MDILRPAHATEQLVDPAAIGPVEPRTGLGHQAEVGRAGPGVGREVVGRQALAVLAGFLVGHGELLGIGPDLIFRQAGATLVGQGAQGHILQTVAACTDLGVDLKAALQLELVELAERAFMGEGHVLDMTPGAFGNGCARANSQYRCGDECDVTEHVRYPLTRPDGLWSRSGR
jgi:hypothetical protein